MMNDGDKQIVKTDEVMTAKKNARRQKKAFRFQSIYTGSHEHESVPFVFHQLPWAISNT